jgi:hypothetical protein
MGYNNAVKAMVDTISNLVNSIAIWDDVLARLGKPVEGESSNVTRSLILVCMRRPGNKGYGGRVTRGTAAG